MLAFLIAKIQLTVVKPILSMRTKCKITTNPVDFENILADDIQMRCFKTEDY